MAQPNIDKLLNNLHLLRDQIEAEVQNLLEQKQEQFKYSLHKGKVIFEQEMRKIHRAQRMNVFLYIITAKLGHILTAPLIYSFIVPALLMDLVVSIYQAVCFRVYGIPQVKRSDYILIDRHRLAYLNLIEKFNCVYCGYGNGVIEYSREVAARTEQYWCPIKHARIARASHDLASNFLDYGDAEAYREKLDEIRAQLSTIDEVDEK